MLVISGNLSENRELVGFIGSRHQSPLPSEQEQRYVSHNRSPALDLPRRNVTQAVLDAVARRNDGRRASPKPLIAFADALEELGYRPFRMWCVQIANELERCSAESCATAVCVLSAALLEAALTFVVEHARSTNLGLFGSSDFNDKPSKWKLLELINGATRGGDAILNAHSQQRALGLAATRQRIHAGRMLTVNKNGVQDLRPEEARDAHATAELIIRAVLDWLDRHPPTKR